MLGRFCTVGCAVLCESFLLQFVVTLGFQLFLTPLSGSEFATSARGGAMKQSSRFLKKLQALQACWEG